MGKITIHTEGQLVYLDKENNELIDHPGMLALFDDYVDEMTGTIEIIGMKYSASRALAELDPVAYDLESGYFIDNLVNVDDSYDILALTDDEIEKWGE